MLSHDLTNKLVLAIRCRRPDTSLDNIWIIIFSEHDKIQNNENISNTFIRIEGDTPEDRLNNLLEIIEEILRPFNLNEQQKNILKRLLEK